MEHINKLLAGAVLVLLVLLIVLILVMQLAEDGAVLISSEDNTLAIIGMAAITIAIIIAETIRSGNISAGYERILVSITGNSDLQDTIEEHYLGLPEGLPKQTVDLLIDVIGHVSKMTPTDADDRLKVFLDEATDGEPN